MATVTTRTVPQENGLGTAGLVLGILALLVCLVGLTPSGGHHDRSGTPGQERMPLWAPGGRVTPPRIAGMLPGW